MKVLTKVLKNILFITAIVITGLCLFAFILSIDINKTLMTSQYHQKLLAKNDVYSYANELIANSMGDISASLKVQSAAQNIELLEILENSTSPKMIKMNIDLINEQLFQYFRGERKSLPDLYIDLNTPASNKQALQISSAGSNNTSEISGKIKKINLHAILLTLNRTDILDNLTLVKFISFVISHITGLSILLAALMLLIISLIYRKPEAVIKWFAFVLLSCGIFYIASAIFLLFCSYKLLPDSMYMISMIIPIKSELIKSYIHDSILPLIVFCFIPGILFPVVSILIHLFNKKLAKIARAIKLLASKLPIKSKNILKYGVMAFVMVSIVSGMCFNLYAFKSGYESNSFSSVVSKLTNTNTVTQVISAKDASIYTFQAKLVDTKTGQPIPNIQVNAVGESKLPKKYFNVSQTTDEDGSVKFRLGEGKFHLSFSSPKFSSDYNLPSPFFYELKTAGTTILTVNLDKQEIIKPADGIGEIEVLDENNMPVENSEFYLEEKIDLEPEKISEQTDASKVSSDTKTVKFYSVTNQEGIAVFKLPPGNYKTGVTSSKFPEGYILPQSFEMSISSDYVTRYTIRLSKEADVPVKQKSTEN